MGVWLSRKGVSFVYCSVCSLVFHVLTPLCIWCIWLSCFDTFRFWHLYAFDALDFHVLTLNALTFMFWHFHVLTPLCIVYCLTWPRVEQPCEGFVVQTKLLWLAACSVLILWLHISHLCAGHADFASIHNLLGIPGFCYEFSLQTKVWLFCLASVVILLWIQVPTPCHV